MGEYVIFGAGLNGQRAAELFGKESITCFVDNNPMYENRKIQGIPVLPLSGLLAEKISQKIIIASSYADEIAAQLEENGITDYIKMYDANPFLQLMELLDKKVFDRDIVFLTEVWQDSLLGLFLEEKEVEAVWSAVHYEELKQRRRGRNVQYIILDSVHQAAAYYLLQADGLQVENCCRLRRYFDTDELLDYPYGFVDEMKSEDWAARMETRRLPERVDAYVEMIRQKGTVPLFQLVEIETINQCNGVCSFCPVNRNDNPQKEIRMQDALFTKIIDELAELNYDGRLSLFSYNEPLLDEKIIARHKEAKSKLPGAVMHLYTNGILLTPELFLELIPYLDELVIDNYNQELKLITPVKKIYEYCSRHEELKKKVTISMRRPKEILSSNGGDAPNNGGSEQFNGHVCALPFQQLVIAPDGKVKLCCLDAYGKVSLGDAAEQKLVDIWYGEAYQKIRNQLYEGRKNISQCRSCDFFQIY